MNVVLRVMMSLYQLFPVRQGPGEARCKIPHVLMLALLLRGRGRSFLPVRNDLGVQTFSHFFLHPGMFPHIRPLALQGLLLLVLLRPGLEFGRAALRERVFGLVPFHLGIELEAVRGARLLVVFGVVRHGAGGWETLHKGASGRCRTCNQILPDGNAGQQRVLDFVELPLPRG
jgi:hypothetical protein